MTDEQGSAEGYRVAGHIVDSAGLVFGLSGGIGHYSIPIRNELCLPVNTVLSRTEVDVADAARLGLAGIVGPDII